MSGLIKLYILLFVIVSFLPGCKRFDKDEPVPSLISVKNASLSCDSITQGSMRHKISDVWVNINGNLQGIYEMPVTFPVIAEGRNNISLRAGIKVNGIAASRAFHPFLNSFTVDTNLLPDMVTGLSPVFTYNSLTKFTWMENFQNNGFTLDRTDKSDTVMVAESDSLNMQQRYGVFRIDATRDVFQYKSTETYTLPSNGSPSYLEIDYQCNHPIVVGLIIHKLQQQIETPLIVLNPHPGSFNHIYIDLTDEASRNPDAAYYNIFIGATLGYGYTSGEVKIDNIKLLQY